MKEASKQNSEYILCRQNISANLKVLVFHELRKLKIILKILGPQSSKNFR